jgi:hypothetical protein
MTSDAQILAPPGAADGGVDPRRWLKGSRPSDRIRTTAGLDGIPADEVTAVLSELPPPLRLVYRVAWRPRYAKISRW